MWIALTGVIPGPITGSVHAKDASARRARAPSIASLSSVRWIALMGVLRTTRGLSVKAPPKLVNVAVTVRKAVIGTLQTADTPAQAPPHPAKTAPAPAVVVRVTVVPGW